MKKFFLLALPVLFFSCAGTFYKPYYAPGVYEGEGQGCNGPIRISVRVSEFAIIDVLVLEHRENFGIGGEALETLTEATLEANSTDIDWVSGATYTSAGYAEALNNALSRAKNED
jgi:uncharacterized protein with FMN-binding domain